MSSQSVDTPNLFGNFNGQFDNVDFVFGVSNLNKVSENANPISVDSTWLETLGNVGDGFRSSGVDSGKNDTVQKEELKFSQSVGEPCLKEMPAQNYAAGGAAFSFGAAVIDQTDNGHVQAGKVGLEFELSNEMKKLNIENVEKGSSPVETVQDLTNTDVLKDGDQYFVFTSGAKSADGSIGNSVPWKSEVRTANSDESNGSVLLKPQPVNEKIFVFGSSRSSTKPDISSFQSQFSDEVKAKGNENASSFSSSLGAESVSGEPEACTSAEDREAQFGFGASSSDFKLPDLDASLSFAANLVNGLSGKLESGPKMRVSRGKYSRKTKGKLKQTKPTRLHPMKKAVVTESTSCSTQDQEAAQCYSPMDFCPYEDTTLNNDVPLSGLETTDQANLRHGCASAVYVESQPNLGFMNGGLGVASTDSGAGISANLSGQESDAAQFCFISRGGSRIEQKFAFTASRPAREPILSLRHQHRRKYKLERGSVSGPTSASHGSSLSSKPHLSRLQGQAGDITASESMGKHGTERNEEQDDESALSAAEQACDKWRKRGNEAYEKGELSKAEDFYTWGVNCVPPDDTSAVAFRPLVRCYSNRAATRMALGRVREAMQDCLMAVKLDPTFHRARIRAANCHLLLGEVEDGIQGFEKSMDSSNVVCLDRQVVMSASDGIQKSQKVIECVNRSAELLKLRTSEAATSALESITEAMSISSYSERLLEMKAEALCMLQKHEEAITLCQQTLDFAEKNFTAKPAGNCDVEISCLNVRQWRHRISSKCHFHLGRLEMALDLLEKQESANKSEEALVPLAVTIRELLEQKTAGNTAFQSGRHAEAVECYTSAISNSMESRPFAAICFCNRAAAHQALGQIADAIADCSLAIALDKNYAKAISRRATLHEMIRDYKHAAADLQRLVCLLEKQSQQKSKESGSRNGKELRQVQQRLSMMEEEAKKDVPLDLYLILGIKKSDPASEIKKAYRKAALRHHPDKAAQALVRGDVGDEGRIWKDIAELIHKDSDRLFKMIGEAYAVLSDPTKREEYDHAEGMRKVLKESNNVRSTSRRYSDYFYSQGHPFERSSNRRYWQDTYRSDNSSY